MVKNYMKLQCLILGVLLIGCVSATVAGNCEELDLSDLDSLENVIYTVVNNQSNLDGVDISINGSLAIICYAHNYKPDEYTLIFTNSLVSETEVVIYRSSGRRTRTVYENVTEFIEVNKIVYQDIIYVDNRTDEDFCLQDKRCIQFIESEESHVGFLSKFWDWVKRLFTK